MEFQGLHQGDDRKGKLESIPDLGSECSLNTSNMPNPEILRDSVRHQMASLYVHRQLELMEDPEHQKLMRDFLKDVVVAMLQGMAKEIDGSKESQDEIDPEIVDQMIDSLFSNKELLRNSFVEQAGQHWGSAETGIQHLRSGFKNTSSAIER